MQICDAAIPFFAQIKWQVLKKEPVHIIRIVPCHGTPPPPPGSLEKMALELLSRAQIPRQLRLQLGLRRHGGGLLPGVPGTAAHRREISLESKMAEGGRPLAEMRIAGLFLCVCVCVWFDDRIFLLERTMS